MSVKKYFVALTFDSEHTTAYLIDKKAMVVARAKHSVSIQKDSPTQINSDPLEWLFSLRVVLTKLFSQSFQSSEIIGIYIFATPHISVIWNKKTGVPVYQAFQGVKIGTDSKILGLKKKKIDEDVFKRTGRLLDESSVGFHWQEIASTNEESATLCFGTLGSWIVFNLTGQKHFVIDYSTANSTQLFHLENKEWDEFLLREFGLTLQSLPQLVPTDSILGETQGFLSLPDGVAILGLSTFQHLYLDQSASVEFEDTSRVFVNIGVKVESKLPYSQTLFQQGKEPFRYSLEGPFVLPYPLLNAFFERDNAEQLNQNPSQTETPPLFIYTHTALLKREVPTSIIGITPVHRPIHFIQAFYQNIAYMLFLFFTHIQGALGFFPKELVIYGQLAYHPRLLQILADALQIPIIRYSTESVLIHAVGAKAALQGYLIKSSAFSKKIELQVLPELDPISNMAQFNAWKDYLEKL